MIGVCMCDSVMCVVCLLLLLVCFEILSAGCGQRSEIIIITTISK